ncbi:hypothetical protein [Moorena producens]|uniref:hypothetical protein n=1 Tax=Moorena producens TaxID=1155739 RepID=UPI003C79456B
MTRKPNSKNTKAEILEAYKELLAERNALEKEMKQMNNAATPQVSTVEKKQTNGSVSAKVMKDKMMYTLDSLVKLQLGFGSSVSELSEKLTSEAAKLEELRTGVTEETQQLAELHNLSEIKDETLDTLIETYQNNSKAFDEEIYQRREELELEMNQLQQSWYKEQEEQQRAIKERNEEQNKTRKRDAQEYDYNLALQRSLDEEAYKHNQEGLYKELEETRQQQEKQWAERENAIAEREKQFEEAKTKVEAFDQEKSVAIKKAQEEGKAIASHQVKIQADLQNKELEGNNRVYQLRIESLEQTIKESSARIHSLSQQLDTALKQVQDLAVKAIEGASNINSYQALKEIALEQAKNPTKGK